MKKIISIMLAFAMLLSLSPQLGDVANAEAGIPAKVVIQGKPQVGETLTAVVTDSEGTAVEDVQYQ